jgi:hypothetical protein
MVVQQLLTLRDPSTVFTARRSMRTLRFYLGFSPPENVRFVRLSELATFKNSHNARLFIHPNENLREPWPQADEIGADRGYRPPDWLVVAGRDDVYFFEVDGR